jgi:hypothetical protein
MTHETLCQQAAARLRQAAIREDYGEVQAAAADYRREVEAAVAARQPHEPPPVEMVREAMALTKWALRVVGSARARANDKLNQVSAVLRYRPAAPRPSTWNLEG